MSEYPWNFVKQWKAFGDASVGTLTKTEQLLYMRLFFVNNSDRRSEWFHISNINLCLLVGIDEKTLQANRNSLKQKGFIDFQKGSSHKETCYKLTLLYVDDGEDEEEIFTGTTPVKTPVKTPDFKKVKEKEKEKRNTPIPPKGKGDAFSKYTDNPELISALRDFEAMRKAIKKPMQESTKGRMLKTLDRLASDDETKIAILNQSTDHNWQGLFELKRNAVPVGSTQGKATREDEEPECGTPEWEEWCRKKDLELFEQFQRGIANG